jgi:uncharacterized protein YegP (UPF0339 family)
MSGFFELKTSKDDQTYFVLKAGNGQVILKSELYTTRAAALNGIASVQKNSPLDERYERDVSKSGKPYFNLKAGNHQVIGTSQLYDAEAGRDHGIESVKTNGHTTDVRDITE